MKPSKCELCGKPPAGIRSRSFWCGNDDCALVASPSMDHVDWNFLQAAIRAAKAEAYDLGWNQAIVGDLCPNPYTPMEGSSDE